MSRLLARPPLLCFGLVALMVSLFLVQRALGALDDVFEGYLFGAVAGFPVREGQIHRLVSATFVHGSVHHLLNNALVLLSPAGFILEAWLGRLRFLVLLGLSMISATAITAWLVPNAIGGGASGVVFGCIGALLVLAARTWHSRAREWRALRVVLLVGLPMEFVFASRFAGIAWPAHGAGLAVGFSVAWLLQTRGRRIDLGLRAAAVILAAFIAYGIARGAWDVSRLDPRDLEGSALARLRSGGSPGELAVASGHLLDAHSDSQDVLRLAAELAERGLAAGPGSPRLRAHLERIRADAARRLSDPPADPPTPPPSGAPRSSRAPRRGRARPGPGRGRPRGGR
jgi:membrane associated rhomboid family serine protease